MSTDDAEIAYLRAVEDLFGALRGVPHILSPKDIHLARELWREGVPAEAVSAGVSEIIDRKRQAGDDEPVVSLSYCRHAIRKSARRMAEQRVGAHGEDSPQPPSQDTTAAAAALVERLNQAAARLSQGRPPVSHVVVRVARELATGLDSSPAGFESLAFDLEAALLDGCWSALEPGEQRRIEKSANGAARSSGATGTALERARRAFRDRELRALLDLPRLELD
jgi:hypothetical protein